MKSVDILHRNEKKNFFYRRLYYIKVASHTGAGWLVGWDDLNNGRLVNLIGNWQLATSSQTKMPSKKRTLTQNVAFFDHRAAKTVASIQHNNTPPIHVYAIRTLFGTFYYAWIVRFRCGNKVYIKYTVNMSDFPSFFGCRVRMSVCVCVSCDANRKRKIDPAIANNNRFNVSACVRACVSRASVVVVVMVVYLPIFISYHDYDYRE